MLYRTNSYAVDTFDIFYFEKNLQGDIIAIYNASGTKLVSYTYDAWGNCSTTYYNGGSSTAAQYNPFRYRGYYYDADLGLYYLNNRYYDSNTGRFLCPDVYLNANCTLVGYNLYQYCNNNPIYYCDYSGTNTEAAAAGWTATMWWLCCADATLPIGDIIYVLGIAVIFVGSLYIADEIFDEPIVFEGDSNLDADQDAETSIDSPDDTIEDDDFDKYYDDDSNFGGRKKISKGKGNTPGDNRRQNSDFDRIARRFNLNKSDSRRLHDEITGKGYGYKEIYEIAKSLFNTKIFPN